MKKLLSLACLALSVVSFADFTVAPNAYASTAGNGGLNTFIRDINATRTGQLLINANQLTDMVGHNVSGITFRLWNGATNVFPPNGANYADYTIILAPSVAVSAMSTNFASNYAGAGTTVRTGAMTINPNTFSVGGNPNDWGQEFTFQNNYLYTGGDLLVEIRHTGSDITNPSNTFADSLSTSVSGYGTDFASVTASGNTATDGAAASFTISRFTHSAVPEPVSMVILGAGALALAAKRRRKA